MKHCVKGANWTKIAQRTQGRANHVSMCRCCHWVILNTKIIQRTEYQTSRVLCSIHASYQSCHGSLRKGNCTCFNKLPPNSILFHHQLCMIRLFCLLAKLLTSEVIRRLPQPNEFKIWKLVVFSGNFKYINFSACNKTCNELSNFSFTNWCTSCLKKF